MSSEQPEAKPEQPEGLPDGDVRRQLDLLAEIIELRERKPLSNPEKKPLALSEVFALPEGPSAPALVEKNQGPEGQQAEENLGFWRQGIEKARQDAEARKVAEQMIEDFLRERIDGFSIQIVNDDNYFIDNEIRKAMGAEDQGDGRVSDGDEGMSFGFLGNIRLNNIQKDGDQWRLNIELLSFEERTFREADGIRDFRNDQEKQRNDFGQFVLTRALDGGPVRAEFGGGLQVVGDMGFMSGLQSAWHTTFNREQRKATYSSYNALSPVLYAAAEANLQGSQQANLHYRLFAEAVEAAQISASKVPWSYATAGLQLGYQFPHGWEFGAEFSHTASNLPSDVSMASDIQENSNNVGIQFSKTFGEAHKGWIKPNSNFRGTGGNSSLGYAWQRQE